MGDTNGRRRCFTSGTLRLFKACCKVPPTGEEIVIRAKCARGAMVVNRDHVADTRWREEQKKSRAHQKTLPWINCPRPYSISHHQNTHLLLAEHTLPQSGECEPHGSVCDIRIGCAGSESRGSEEEDKTKAKKARSGKFSPSVLCSCVFPHANGVFVVKNQKRIYSNLPPPGRESHDKHGAR